MDCNCRRSDWVPAIGTKISNLGREATWCSNSAVVFRVGQQQNRFLARGEDLLRHVQQGGRWMLSGSQSAGFVRARVQRASTAKSGFSSSPRGRHL